MKTKNLLMKRTAITSGFMQSLFLLLAVSCFVNCLEVQATTCCNSAGKRDNRDSGSSVLLVEENTKYKVGDFAQGGIVFWVDETGSRGLVCAIEDQSPGTRWAYRFIDTHVFGDGLFAGKENTAKIIAAQTAAGDYDIEYAARMCDELVITIDGLAYDDWYLPSRTEVNLMWQNRYVINRTAVSNGGRAFESDGLYWSSNERTDNLAWIQVFYSINQHYYFKSDRARVRAIRAFNLR